MKIQFVLALLCAVVVQAISLSLATVLVNDQSIHFGEISTQEIKQLTIDSVKDKIEFDIELSDVTTQPHQAIITLGDGKGLDWVLYPKFILSKKLLKLTTTVSKIPLNIRNLDKVFIELIVADKGKKNLQTRLGELVPTEELKSLVSYKKAERFGLQPEIHHIFRQDAETVNPIVPIVFIAADVVVFLGLLGVWSSQIGKSVFTQIQNTPKSQLGINILFLSTLVGFEIVFVRYYLGTSIFTTLFHSFILAIPALFFGSRALRHLAYLRRIGKA